MTRAKRTELDKIADDLKLALAKRTATIKEIGDLLIESRQHLKHGEWEPWLTENFDLSYRTALRYVKVAEYTDAKYATVADLEVLSPSVLYRLAEGGYSKEEEAAIWAVGKTRPGKDRPRIDINRAQEICRGLVPSPEPDEAKPEPEEKPLDDPDDDETDSILDGPPPDLPSPEQAAATDFLLPAFDQAIAKLKELSTKRSEKFLGSVHSASDIDAIAEFLAHISHLKGKAAA